MNIIKQREEEAANFLNQAKEELTKKYAGKGFKLKEIKTITTKATD